MHFQDDHPMRDSNRALKINRGSHFIRKSPSSSSSTSTSSSSSSSSVINGMAASAVPSSAMPQPRHPVIIYTHSPKVIHTQPKDFMALVQKLTGFSRPSAAGVNDDGRASPPSPPPKAEPCDEYIITNITNNNNSNSNREIVAKNNGLLINEDNDSTSVVTDEKEGSCSVGQGFDPQNNSFDNNEYLNINNSNNNNNNNSVQFFHPTSMDFLCSGPPFGNCVDSFFMRSSISSSSSSLESVKDLPDF